MKPKPPQDAHTGIMGPIMRAVTGQVLTVVLKNNLGWPVNLEPAGALPADPSESSITLPNGMTTTAMPVAPGETITYRFLIGKDMGPTELEPSAKLWLYR